MRAGDLSVFRTIAIGSLLLLASPVAAVDFGLQVFAEGTLIATVNQDDLGCTPDASDPNKAYCRAQDIPYGDSYTAAEVDIGNPDAAPSDPDYYLVIDSDPTVTGTIGVTNAQAFTQHFSFVFTLPVSSMPGGTLTGGRVSGTLTDQGGGGATVSTFGPGYSFYTATLDGSPWQQLYTDPQSFSVLNGSTGIPLQSFGLPGPSLPGPAVAASIGITLDFVLTGQDAVSFNSNHIVTPEPGTAALLGLGLLGLAIRRHRDEHPR
jgi:hypothetical protein